MERCIEAMQIEVERRECGGGNEYIAEMRTPLKKAQRLLSDIVATTPDESDNYRERVESAFLAAQDAQTAWFDAQRELEKIVGDDALFDDIEDEDLTNYTTDLFIDNCCPTICHVCDEPITDEQIDTETPEGTIHMECEKQ